MNCWIFVDTSMKSAQLCCSGVFSEYSGTSLARSFFRHFHTKQRCTVWYFQMKFVTEQELLIRGLWYSSFVYGCLENTVLKLLHDMTLD